MAYLQKMILAANWGNNGLSAAKQFGRDVVLGPVATRGSTITVCQLGKGSGPGASGSGHFDSPMYEAFWLFCCNNYDPGNAQWGGFTYGCMFGVYNWGAWDGSKEWNYNASQAWSFDTVTASVGSSAYNDVPTAIQYICMAKS